jgi:T5SS/PEP-CTERM-associated repeat protein/autotransporter-associated beta strand protein
MLTLTDGAVIRSGSTNAAFYGSSTNYNDAYVGFGTSSSNNAVLIDGNAQWIHSGTVYIGYGGSGTVTVANGGVLAASKILIGQYGDLDFGRYLQSDSAGSVAGEIVFTANNDENFGINFNQTNTFNFSNNVSGPGWICALGTGTTIMSGSNSYSQYTKIDAGTIVAASTNALGTGYLQIGGTSDKATLMLATNLSVADFNWGSNAVVALTAGSQILTVAAMTNLAVTIGGNIFDLQGTAQSMSLNNNTNTLINFSIQSGFTTNSFSVQGISGYSFALTSTNVSVYLSTNANVVASNNITISNTLTVGSFTVAGASTTTVASTGTLNASEYVLVTGNSTLVDNGLIVTPSVTVDQGSTLMGSGTLSLTGGNLTVNGTIAPGNSPGTFYVTGGNLVMGSTATWDQQIYSASVYDRVVVTGSAFLNGTMNIASYGSGGLQYGQKYNFLTASGGISGAFTSIIAPNGFRGRLLLSGNNTEANILIAPSSYTLLAQGNNQIQVATALDSFIPATSGDRLVISTSLDSLSASQYAQAFNAIMPTMYQSMATIAFNQANALNMQLNQRLWGVRLAEGGGFSMSGMDNMPMLEGQGDGAGSGKGVLDSKKDILRPGTDNHWGMFVDANGIFANANSGNMLPGYSAQSGGINTGLIYKWNDSFASGLYCGYQGTYSKMGASGSGLGTGSSLIDNAVRFGVLGTYGHKDGKGLYGNALAGGAYHNYQATRVIQYTGVNRTANSAPGAGELDTMLATGYDIQKGKFTFGPTASLQYTYLGVNPVNETGAQSLNFNSGGWNSSSMLSSVGAHAAYNWQAGKNVVVVPQVALNWQHEFLQSPYDITGNLGGTSPTFSNTSATGIRDYLYTGVGFTVELNKKWNTSFFYNAAAGNSDLVSQNIFWSAGVKF